MACYSCSVDNINNIPDPNNIVSESKIRARTSLSFGVFEKLKSDFKLETSYIFSTPIGHERLNCGSVLYASPNMNFGLNRRYEQSSDSDIRIHASVNGKIQANIVGGSNIPKILTDKFSGDKLNFSAYEKLYPVEDIYFVNKSTQESVDNLIYDGETSSLLDEGVFIGSYTQNNTLGFLLADDENSALFHSNIFNEGDIEYKFKVNKPLSVAKNSYFAIRAVSPFDDYKSRKPHQYKIYDIKFEDPEGNLIIEYNDIIIKGDTYYTTYISQPKVNNLLKRTWEDNYPLMDIDGSYTLKFTLSFDCTQYPFTPKFNTGFEQTCIIASGSEIDIATENLASIVTENDLIIALEKEQIINALEHLSISAIEIGNSGGVGILRDNYLNFFNLAQQKSNRVTKSFIPTKLFTNTFDNGIYPQSNSVWQGYPQQVTNLSESGADVLLKNINGPFKFRYIELLNSTPHQDSGRLILKFDSSLDSSSSSRNVDGSFVFGKPTDFNIANLTNYVEPDVFFEADSIKLKIIAKKSENTPDFYIDVVGYSDDKILNVTPSIGGFLQNDSSVSYILNDIPDISGINNNTLTISENPLSDDTDYYQKDISPFGDHYIVTNSPVINSTDFAEYIIPLEIRHDPNKLGSPTKYGLTSFLENLYLDISPLPSGAIISSVRLIIDYIPADGLSLHTLASPSNRLMTRKPVSLFPQDSATDVIYNTIDKLVNIAPGLTTPADIKTNYARRWRGGSNAIVSGAFDIIFDNFEFEFFSPSSPFSHGYVDFSNQELLTNNIKSIDNVQIAEFVSSETIDNYLLHNVGWRLSSDQLFNNAPITPYKSISWANNIYDAFDRAVRVSGVDRHITLGQTPLHSNGWAVFLRFTPDNTIPNNQCIISKSDIFNTDFQLRYSGGYLYATAMNGTIFAKDNLHWSEYQYPLSVLVTFNNDGDPKLKIYTDNELLDSFNHLVAQSEIEEYAEDPENILNIGYSNLTGDVDLPMFVHEFGVSNLNCNFVDGNPNRRQQQFNISEFFKSHRMHFWKNGDTQYRSEQYTYIDNDISKWHLGAFKICEFSSAFDFFTERDGNDYLMHNLTYNGQAYSEIIDKSIPSKINLSGVCYHTQIENDFLRFNISDIPDYFGDRFYGIAPRISKTLPRGYSFDSEAICVDTIIEHETENNIVWNNGNVGPKFIVSLYSPISNNPDRPSKDFGLINRAIHYLEPSGCIRKITSKFTFDSLLDNSEPWAVFDQETYQQEFKEKYLSKHLDDMFLQYDIVYPSGTSFQSNIKIYSANIRLENSIVLSSGEQNNFTLYSSGELYQDGYLNLFNDSESILLFNSGLSLLASGDRFFVANSGNPLTLFIDSESTLIKSSGLSLVNRGLSSISFNPTSNFGSVFGDEPFYPPVINLYTSGNYIVETQLSLYVSSFGPESFDDLNLVTFSKDTFLFLDNQFGDRLSLYTLSNQPINVYPSSVIPMFIETGPYYATHSVSCNLFIQSFDPNIIQSFDTLNLHTINYPISVGAAGKSASIVWNSENTGSDILASDNIYAYVDSDDNIRGVDIICYGDCNSQASCSETEVTIHGVTYYSNECVDGGIFRAQTTYTNLTFESGIFKHNDVYTEGAYSGNFYGIRKYSGLAPFLPYNVIIEGQTGSTRAIDIPSEFIEVEYNQDEEDNVDSYNRSLMNYNGIRLISDSDNKNSGDEFGKCVAAKKDILVVGSPKQTIIDNEGEELDNAGSVYIYKRRSRPSGFDWNNDFKSPWILETELSLPVGLRKDYSLQFPEDKISFEIYNLSIQKTRWYTGQEGREFGHSVDLAINDNQKSIGEDSRQIIVVGGPNAKWTRTFPEFESKTVNIGVVAFIDSFEKTILTPLFARRPPVELTYEYILDSIQNKDFLYRYFASPSVKFNIHVIIYVANADEPLSPNIVWPDAPKSYPLSITVKRISRNQVESDPINQTKKILDGMKSGFLEAFPSSGDIPPLLGFYVDNSFSLGKNSLMPALSGFMNFYKEYSYASGLYTNDIKDSGQIIELVLPPDPVFDPKNWIYYSNEIINYVLDSGNLTERNHVRFITNQIGEFYGNEAEFNIPPESGGKVYIFEKESGSWNLIQEIKSPNVTYEYPDRFGHAVSISDDTEVIAIGSPYINQALMVYEYKSNQKEIYYNSIYNWIISKGKENFYKNSLSAYNQDFNTQKLYLSLTQEDKFLSRRDLGIEEYQNIYSFTYGDIQPIGSWEFIPSQIAPTARLGYSVDINEDGSKIVIGSPTDSMNHANDADVYYAYNGNFRSKSYFTGYNGNLPTPIKTSWPSSLNAGAIHVFESRKYYPHNAVLDYGRFGNLHRSLNDNENSLDYGHFDYLEQIFSDKEFIRTPFSQNAIPQEAGLMFITTPQVNALSDEVVNNIIEWLALGDRNLVLVGNDPIWESDGAYLNSNEIINNLLVRLNSRMKIVPARNRYESLPNGYSDFDNVLPSFLPFGATPTFTRRLPLRASGVADIRITNTFNGTVQNCIKQIPCGSDPPPIQIQSRCEMPLVDGGDLRAQSIAICCGENGKPLTYYVNWPYEYKTYIPSCADVEFSKVAPFVNREPVPLLTAAEKVNIEFEVPEIPAVYNTVAIYDYDNFVNVSYSFGPLDESRPLDLLWISNNGTNSGNYTFLDTNYTNKTNEGRFIDPVGSGLLEATAQLAVRDIEYEIDNILDDKARYCVREKYLNTDSEIILIANVKGESNDSLTSTNFNNNDRNRGFYYSLFNYGESLAQLALWENQTIPFSFKDAFPDSILGDILPTQVMLRQGVNLDTLRFGDINFNVAWISNVSKYPLLDTNILDPIKSWLSSGKKKLILTYDFYSSDEDKKNLNKVKYICNYLGLSIKPLQDSKGFYKDNIAGTFIDISPMNVPNLTSINSFNFTPYNPIGINTTSDKVFTLAYQDSDIIEKLSRLRNGNYWYMNAGIAKVSFPAIANSGYKIFITTDNDSDDLPVPINVQVGNAIQTPELPSTLLASTSLNDLVYNADFNNYQQESVDNIIGDYEIQEIKSTRTTTINVQVGPNANSIDIYISSNIPRITDAGDGQAPKTLKLMAISGVAIPVLTNFEPFSVPRVVGYETVKVSDAVPGYTSNIDLIRTIQTDNTKYCTDVCLRENLGGQFIEDGPVVAAQEVEFITSFEAGYKRSRVTVLTDASMIQGRYISENNIIPYNTYEFIRSLYPETDFNFINNGRQFVSHVKLVSPERGSPLKYLNYTQGLLPGMNNLFGGYELTSALSEDKLNRYESEYDPMLVNRPKVPWEDEIDGDEIEKIKNELISGVLNQQSSFYTTCKFSGIIEGKSYVDAGIGGGIPEFMKDKGYDYIDLDNFASGYPGDLFGYSVSIKKDKILVGSPFSAFASEQLSPWTINSNLYLGYDGGGGSAYMFDKTPSGWQCSRKLRPDTLMGQLSGINIYSDQFGHSVSIDNDIIAIGAPSHDYGNDYNIINNSGAFVRKSFNESFFITDRRIIDLGNFENRETWYISNYGENAGAIYVYDNSIIDWERKIQDWRLVEKVTATVNDIGNENERFGRTTYLSQSNRNDSNYVIVMGCPTASGDIDNVGAVYTKDIVLRKRPPSLQNPETWIDAKVFGYTDQLNELTVGLSFSNNLDNQKRYLASGVIRANENGDIFVEVSGQDPATKGFIEHRPYIKSIIGQYVYGNLNETGMVLYAAGKNTPEFENLNLVINAENSAYVYNTLGLFNKVIIGSGSPDPSGCNLFTMSSSGTLESLNLIVSSGDYSFSHMNLYTRGK